MRGDARAHLEAGTRAYQLQDWDAAISEFKLGFNLDARAEFLYAIAQAYRMKGDCEHAIRQYESVKRAPDGAELAAAADQNIQRCRKASPPPRQRPTADVATRDDAAWYRDWIGHSLVAGGVMLCAGGAVTWWVGRDQANATYDQRVYDDWLARYRDAQSAVTFERVGIAVGALGIGVAIAGVVHYVWPQQAATPLGGGVAIAF